MNIFGPLHDAGDTPDVDSPTETHRFVIAIEVKGCWDARHRAEEHLTTLVEMIGEALAGRYRLELDDVPWAIVPEGQDAQTIDLEE